MPLKWGDKENERPGPGKSSYVGVDIVKNDVAWAGRAFYDKSLLMSEIISIGR